MKRKTPLFLALLLALVFTFAPVANAAYLGSPERADTSDEVEIDDVDVPLVELPTTELAPTAQVDASGAAVAEVAKDALLSAVEAAVSSGDVRITVAPAGTAGASAVTAAMDKEALQAVADGGMELAVSSSVGQMVMPSSVLSSILGSAAGSDVQVAMERKSTDHGAELLSGIADVDPARIEGGSVTEVDIRSGGANITSWSGGSATLSLPVGSGRFEAGKGYTVYQFSADGSMEQHTGYCVFANGAMRIELSITHLSTFVVLADAVEDDMGAIAPSVTPSPLAASVDTTVGTTASSGNMATVWFGAAAVVAISAVAVIIVSKKRRKV